MDRAGNKEKEITNLGQKQKETGQGRNLFICQERKGNGAHERTGKKHVYLSGKEEKRRP